MASDPGVSELLEGEESLRFLKDYNPVELLGSGGFGVVFEAQVKLTSKSYAVKITKFADDDKEKTMREIDALSQLRHDNIVMYATAWTEENTEGWGEKLIQKLKIGESQLTAREFLEGKSDLEPDDGDGSSDESDFEGLDDSGGLTEASAEAHSTEEILHDMSGTNLLYIVMELCEKRTLEDYLREGKRNVKDSWLFFQQICLGVEYIHSKLLIHRDLKPSNIFFGKDGKLKIGDFGLAKSASLSQEEEVSYCHGANNHNHTFDVGTTFYMSPEQIKRQPYDHKVDIFAMGLILMELLNNFSTTMEKLNFLQSKVKSRFHFNAPPDDIDFIREMICETPAKRPEASELLNNEKVDRAHKSGVAIVNIVHNRKLAFTAKDLGSATLDYGRPKKWTVVPSRFTKQKISANHYWIPKNSYMKFKFYGKAVGGEVFLFLNNIEAVRQRSTCLNFIDKVGEEIAIMKINETSFYGVILDLDAQFSEGKAKCVNIKPTVGVGYAGRLTVVDFKKKNVLAETFLTPKRISNFKTESQKLTDDIYLCW